MKSSEPGSVGGWERARLTALLESASDLAMTIDRSGVVTHASPGLASTLGREPDEWVGQHFLNLVDPSQQRFVKEELDHLLRAGSDATVELSTMLRRADGQTRSGELVLVNLLGDGGIDAVIVTFRDVTEQRDLERQLSHRAFHDELTGLANRALLLDRMDHALSGRDEELSSVMVLFIDLDDFKMVNDQHGHEVGDRVLAAVARRVGEAAGSGDTAARLGGDEFAILLEKDTGIDGAIEKAERLLETLRLPIRFDGVEITVLASIGIAMAATGTTTTGILRDADVAMYEAKRAGKGQVRIFDPAMRQLAMRHLRYRHELADALGSHQMHVVYLPFVDLWSGAVRGAEALARWTHPEDGDVAPADFLPVAERSGLIVEIGRWVLDEALDQAQQWRDDLGLFMSVNMTAAELEVPDFVDFVMSALADRYLPPEILVIEVTELAIAAGSPAMAHAIQALRSSGVRVAVDDFGRGPCAVGTLQRQPVDLLKLDPTVTGALGRRPAEPSDAERLARAVIRVAETLDLVSVGEGLETWSQLHDLRALGCQLGQGRVLSAPLNSEQLARRFSIPETFAV